MTNIDLRNEAMRIAECLEQEARRESAIKQLVDQLKEIMLENTRLRACADAMAEAIFGQSSSEVERAAAKSYRENCKSGHKRG